jgi:hypothetical protein
MHHRLPAVALLAALTLVANEAAAQTDLSNGTALRIRSNGAAEKHKIIARFLNVPLLAIPDCSMPASVRVATSSGDSLELELDCGNWQTLHFGKYRYKAASAAALTVRRITYGDGKLLIKIRGENAALLSGSETFAEVRFSVNADRTKYCGRFAALTTNTTKKLSSRGPTSVCTAFEAERAFWDTINMIDGREAEAVALFDQAVVEIPTDGRAWFLKGMFHMYRQIQTLDWDNPSQFVLDEVDLAEAALDAAVPLLPADVRIPGFLGAATYVGGITHNDPVRTQLALDRMRDAIVLWPLFNVFNFVGTVGIYVDNTDPLFTESIDYMDQALASGCSPFTEAEICGNLGRAPRNIEGSFMLFGDLYAKAGDAPAAADAYNLAVTFADLNPNPYLWRAELDDRVANLATRIALYQDADPLNDPLIIGEGNHENCLFCHGQ